MFYIRLSLVSAVCVIGLQSVHVACCLRHLKLLKDDM